MNNGIRSVTARRPVDELVQRLTTLLAEKNIKLFAVVDHSGEAATVGLRCHTPKLLIFGNPKAGTPVMLSAASTALDLPLKILLSQEPDGTTQSFLERCHLASAAPRLRTRVHRKPRRR